MGYAAFGKDSDVMTYESVAGEFVCDLCKVVARLSPEPWPRFVADTRSAMIAHLKRHRDEGDKVPERALELLERELRERGEDSEPVDVDGLAKAARAQKIPKPKH